MTPSACGYTPDDMATSPSFYRFFRKRLTWRYLGTTLFVAGVGIVAAAWLAGGKLVAPATCVVGSPPSDLPFQTLTLESQSGAQVAAWYLPGESSGATVVLLHPFRGNRRTMLPRARLFHERGFSVLLVDLQAHGESTGKHITVGYLERYDVQAAVAWARQQRPDDRIGVLGVSLGGAAALLGSPLNVDALVVESVYPTINEAVDNRIAMRTGVFSKILTPVLLCQLKPRLGITTDDLRPIDHIADCDCPILVACGDNDRHTTLDETQHLFASAGEPKQLFIFEGAEHEDLQRFDPEKYNHSIVSFLERQLVVATCAATR
ncbi:MAG: alpha/beta hydrolase [Pirellulaceae bacterium]|nr:alpha/beta hydrolase [Planctomycetales bacterium]